MIYDRTIEEFLKNVNEYTKSAKIEVEVILKNYVYNENDSIELDVIERHKFIIPKNRRLKEN